MHSWSPWGHGTFRSFFHSSVCTLTRSLSHSFVLSFVRSFVGSVRLSVGLSVSRSFLGSFVGSFVVSFVRPFLLSFVGSLVRSFFRSVRRSFVPMFCRFVHFVYLTLDFLIKYCGCDDGINSGENLFFFFSFLYFMSEVIIPISCKWYTLHFFFFLLELGSHKL